MAPLTQAFHSDLSLAPNSYIYKILSTSPRTDPLSYFQTDALAVISSDDSLHFINPATLKVLPDGVIKNVNESVTCLERVDDPLSNVVATAGRDGMIRFWDKRNRNKVMLIQSPNKLISSLVCNNPRNFIAAGIENPDDGPGVSPVLIWDQRNVQKPLLELIESHTDTITDLQLHPNHPTLLLSSSTDGLVNIFDVSKPDEEEALYQVINHRSAVAHAGFMYPTTDIYTLGTDETMSFYALQSHEEEEEPTPTIFGDMREKLDCEYMAKIHWVGDEAFIAAGKHSSSTLDLIPIQKAPQSPPLQYDYDLEMSLRLPDAHGGEIIRDVFTDVHSHTTYTVGEDGFIRAWKLPGDEGMDIDDEGALGTPKRIKDKDRKEKRMGKKEKRKGPGGNVAEGGRKARYNPY
ncbi:WD40 repeat-like protein [Lindgomyces ingoldianus]|uniref:WD40 repeat-like protein n=1 Tax=Lindgomyces ingoldianus TaxID=673940 RepID=A0ACB6QP05_9PLEO|nr:WD40 repeat-like protein [Lindgomyces ingoldianus]KAF2468012.1 WD40 repeat-like protein [Lindgomyces ingoldianus]